MMASQKLIEIVRHGRKALARWRQEHPTALLNLSEADLSGIDLRGANLRRADLTGANLSGADLSGAQLIHADLTRARLDEARLIRADLTEARLFTCSLSRAKATAACFRQADLSHSTLSKSDLSQADFTQATLDSCDLTLTQLSGTIFRESRLHGAELTNATMNGTLLAGLRLAGVRGLESIRHTGPSTLGLDTARLSAGSLPAGFLRGCGTGATLLRLWDQLFSQALDNVHVFVVCVKEDLSLAESLCEKLRAQGVCCWLDCRSSTQESSAASSTPSPADDQRTFLCLSKASLNSPWMNAELEQLMAREEQARKQSGRNLQLLFPLNLDGHLFSGDFKHRHEKQLARVAVDLVGWRRNNTKLDQELTGLIRALTAETK